LIAELPADSFERLRPLLPQPCIHLAVESILVGATPARVFVDQAEQPRSALAWSKNHFFLAGDPVNPGFNQDLNTLFTETIYPQRQADGGVMLELFPLTGGDSSEVTAQAMSILAGKDPLPDRREVYRFEAFKQDWRAMLPREMALVLVTQALIDQKNLTHMDDLTEELVSEHPSVASFLEKSFGVALIAGLTPIESTTLAGWCLSEYNLPGRCEVGIETVDGYRKRGLGTLLGSALVAEAQARGIHQVSWHCFAWNTASSATARKIGFTQTANYPIYFAWYHPASNLAVHGNIYLSLGQYPASLEWFEKSLALLDAPAWVDWGAGCACARLNDLSSAISHLEQAIAKGFTHKALFQNSPHLDGLRGAPAWDALMEKLT
jgi:GNAT superfamily N-acetyltransferase